MEKPCRHARFIHPYLSADEFLNGTQRFCIWLENESPREWRSIPSIVARVRAVQEFRLRSKKAKTREDANVPALFAEIRQPRERFLAVPKTSSEHRPYIPIAFLPPQTIVASELYFCQGATPFHFGVLSSSMHMAWVRHVCGRLEMRYRYSNSIVYNNFIWPQNVTDAKREAVEECSQAV